MLSMEDLFSTRCVYCLRESSNLKSLPKELKVDERNKYCPTCYPRVRESVLMLPWNRDVFKKGNTWNS